MANTQENLKAAFAGESQANRRYLFSAEAAEKEGHPQIARLFRAVAEAETIHARNHLQTLGEVKDTKANLEAAISGESHEFKEVYPEFISQAQTEGIKRAALNFSYANEVEKVHYGLYTKALEALNSGKEPESKPYYICAVCGMTVEGEAPDKCPVCGAPKSRFRMVE
ncbi:MAG: rubrerythrin family protein [Chloroflexota bacterium]